MQTSTRPLDLSRICEPLDFNVESYIPRFEVVAQGAGLWERLKFIVLRPGGALGPLLDTIKGDLPTSHFGQLGSTDQGNDASPCAPTTYGE